MKTDILISFNQRLIEYGDEFAVINKLIASEMRIQFSYDVSDEDINLLESSKIIKDCRCIRNMVAYTPLDFYSTEKFTEIIYDLLKKHHERSI